MGITHFNGFDKGVIGKPLPADTTLNNMRKADLIELLHIAESNHDVLAQAYRIAVDNSKCNQCPLGRDREKIRADAIDEFIKTCDEHAKYDIKKHPQNAYCLNRLTLLKIAEQLKQNN